MQIFFNSVVALIYILYMLNKCYFEMMECKLVQSIVLTNVNKVN